MKKAEVKGFVFDQYKIYKDMLNKKDVSESEIPNPQFCLNNMFITITSYLEIKIKLFYLPPYEQSSTYWRHTLKKLNQFDKWLDNHWTMYNLESDKLVAQTIIKGVKDE